MKKQVLTLLVLFCGIVQTGLYAQTLAPGDIAVIGIGVDTGPPSPSTVDEFAWVPLVNLAAGTKIYFTDAGWNTASNSFMGTGLSDDILLRYVAPTFIDAGTVMLVTEASIPANYTVIQNTQCGNDQLLTLSNSGDQIIVFQSNAAENSSFPGTSFTPIFAATTTTTNWASLTNNIATVTQNDFSNLDNCSNLPPGLTASTSIAAGNNAGYLDEADNIRYTGTTSGSRTTLLASITNYANWSRHDLGGNQADFDGAPTGWTRNGVTQYAVSGADVTPAVVSSIVQQGTPAPNSSSVSYVITFNEQVVNVSTDDFQITSTGSATGSIASVSESSGTSMTIVINSLAGTGTVKPILKPNTNIKDAWGNGGGTNGYVATYTSAGTHSVDLDRPSLTITSPQPNPTNATGIQINFNFSENVTGFVSGDVTVSNGSISTLVGSGSSFSGTVTPAADGTVTVNVPAAVAQDAASNLNTAATQFSIVSDRTQPTVSITSSQSSPTNANTYTVSITFSSAVSNFVAGDIAVGNGAVTSFSGSGANYTAGITPTANGTVTVNINAGVANDPAGNTNPAATQFSFVSDKSQPTVSMSSSQASPTNSSQINLTVSFSEPVTGFVAGDIVITNGNISGFFGSGPDYFVTITPSSNGTVTANIGNAVAVDSAGNTSTAATQFSIVQDTAQPTVSISSVMSNPTNATTIPININFSESVNNFLVGDITVSNGTLSSFSGSGSSYTVNVAPSADGTVTINIGASVANDAAGNGNTAATQFSIVSDRIQPGAVISSVTSNPTNANPIPVAVTFSESVNGFAANDLIIGNGTLSNFAGSGASYSFDVTPSSNGLVTVEFVASAASDIAGNVNTAVAQFSRVSDTQAPTVSISSNTPSPTNSGSIALSVVFSETVTGLTQTDIVVSNGSIASFSGSGTSYSFNLIPSANGVVTVNIAAGVANDPANNGNTAATQFSIVYDSSGPLAVISSLLGSPTNAGAIPITVTFNETVSGFDSSDITVGNGYLSDFSGSGAAYSATITPAASGIVTVDISGGSAQDAAGNANAASVQFAFISDTSAPTPVISSSSPATTNASSITVNVTFDESVTGFTASDITVGNGSLTNFAGAGTNYSFTLTPSANGTVTVDIGAGVATDAAGNSNNAASGFSIVSDTVGPILAITSTLNNPTNAVSIPLTFTYNENVIGFTADDIFVSGGVLTNFAGSGSVYTADLFPSADGTINIFVFQNTSTDAAGNNNSLSSFSTVSDRTRPTVSISSPATTPTSESPIIFNINFSEAVTDFIASDISVTGGTITGFSGSGSSYTFNLVPGGSGNKTVNVAANRATDAAGNQNFAAAQFSIFYITPCSLSTTWNGLFWTNGEPVASQPAVIAADFTAYADIEACSLIVGNMAQVTIPAGFDVKIGGNVTVQAGASLTFESNANLIQTNATNGNNGPIVSKRNAVMKRLDYVYWSSPVAGQNLLNFSPLTIPGRFYEIDEPSNTFVPLSTTNFVPGKGYTIRAPNTFPADFTPAVFNGVFTGTPNNATISIATTELGFGYNLIGNPYPSPISADLFLAQNPGTLYFYTHLTSAGGGSNYAVYNETGTAAPSGGEAPNGFIQTGQGFVFKPVTAGTATFLNSMRTGDNTGQFFRTSNDNRHRIWVSLSTDNTMMNQMLIGYVPGATNAIDVATDGPLNYTGSSISSRISDNNYVIQGRALPFTTTDTVPLNFKAETEGLFQLKLDNFDGVFAEGQNVYLEDTQSQLLHNLNEGPYNFTSVPGNFADRFIIRYENVALGTPQLSPQSDQVLIYKYQGVLTINSGQEPMHNIEIYDIGGRLIYSRNDISGAELRLHDLHAQSQVLLVKVTTESATITKKVAY